MCEHWCISNETFKNRLRRNWSLEKALTEPPESDMCKDHLGHTFSSMKEMCEYWKIDASTYRYRRKQGYTIEQALTMPLKSRCYDHLGNTFPNLQTMCDYWNIALQAYKSRIKNGWSQEKALTTPSKTGKCYDHLGNEFVSIQEMCKHYNISTHTYYVKKRKNISLENILTTPIRHSTKKHTTVDPYGNEFSSETIMAKTYHVSVSNWKRDKKSLIERLKIIPSLNRHIQNYTFDPHLTIMKPVNHNNQQGAYTPKFFICIFDGYEVMLPYTWIIQYCEQHLPPEKNPIQ